MICHDRSYFMITSVPVAARHGKVSFHQRLTHDQNGVRDVPVPIGASPSNDLAHLRNSVKHWCTTNLTLRHKLMSRNFRPEYIYGLRDEMSGFYHYIGITALPKQRLSQHSSTSRQKLIMDILQTTYSIHAKTIERKWIRWALRHGHPLTNSCDLPPNSRCKTCGGEFHNSHITHGLTGPTFCPKSIRHDAYWRPRGQMKLFL